MATVETPADSSAVLTTPPAASRNWRTTLTSTEVDTRLLGMLASLAAIWIAFHVLSDGGFLTARNLWNLSVQSTSIAIMATGMVLIIVSRNIDLSVGSLLGFLGYTMALVQTDGILDFFGLSVTVDGLDNRVYVWVVALLFGLLLGAIIGGLQGFIVAYVGVPSFIVTLGGFLVWRGMIFRAGDKQGQTPGPAERELQADRRRRQGLARRVAQLGPRAARLCPHPPQHLAGPPPAATVRPRAATHVGRHHARRRRVRRRARRGRPRGEQVHLADHRRSDRRRLPRRHPDPRHAGHELPRPAPGVRPLRVRLRRQPGGRRARRHQHPPHGDVHVRR